MYLLRYKTSLIIMEIRLIFRRTASQTQFYNSSQATSALIEINGGYEDIREIQKTAS
jgi:hypothetical protein